MTLRIDIDYVSEEAAKQIEAFLYHKHSDLRYSIYEVTKWGSVLKGEHDPYDNSMFAPDYDEDDPNLEEDDQEVIDEINKK